MKSEGIAQGVHSSFLLAAPASCAHPNRNVSRRRRLLGILFIVFGTKGVAQSVPEIVLPAATVGRPYSYQIPVATAGGLPASFEKIDGNAEWLQISPSGVLSGTPDSTAPGRTLITIRGKSEGGSQATGVFVVPVETIACPRASSGSLAWCSHTENVAAAPPTPRELSLNQAKDQVIQLKDVAAPNGDKSVDRKEVIQFDRIWGPYGAFGHFVDNHLQLIEDPQSLPSEFARAVNASKVRISGSILYVPGIEACSKEDWYVVTEGVQSSNILVYGPSELTVFCQPIRTQQVTDQPAPRQCDDFDCDAVILLPVHVIWANVFHNHNQETFEDPSWRPLGEVPKGYDCYGNLTSPEGPAGDQGTLVPPQGIRPCNLLKSSHSPFEPVLRGFGLLYSGLTQPGVTQGSLSAAPFDLAAKGTYDAQAYWSYRVGPGWIGAAVMFEHDVNAKDDLNSLTSAITYDWTWGDRQSFIWSAGQPKASMPSSVGIRVPEYDVRFGPEFTAGPPGGQYTNPDAGKPATNGDSKKNLVAGATVKLPIIFSFSNQPSAFSLMPVVGFERGARLGSPEVADAPEPHDISRFLGGVDTSLRMPWKFGWHTFFGDKPATLDYSYRIRQLFSPEPYLDMDIANPKSVQEISRAGTRTYQRVTYLVPFSEYVQLRIAWQRGSLPPEFANVGNLVTFGVTFSNPGSIEH